MGLGVFIERILKVIWLLLPWIIGEYRRNGWVVSVNLRGSNIDNEKRFDRDITGIYVLFFNILL